MQHSLASLKRLDDQSTSRNSPLLKLPSSAALSQISLSGFSRHSQKQRKAKPTTFGEFLPTVSPRAWRFDWPHSELIQEHIDRVTSGEIKRLMIFMPPRHNKSETVTVRYPVYRLQKDPTFRGIIGAYNQTLASKFSRKARRIAETIIDIADDRKAVDDWETSAGGGVRAVGVGGGVTGQGADLILIDDPVKSREEADSEVYREKVWDWYREDLYSRLEPGGAIILIMTRWHEDDLAGRILESENASEWTVLSLPAIAEEDDQLGRPVGEALCPDRYDVEALADIRRVMGEYGFSALYQQRPSPREGSFFKVHNLEIVDAAPASLQKCRAWDFASTEGDGDYSAGVLIGRAEDGIFYVLDVVRGQWDSSRRDKQMRQTAALDGKLVTIRGPQDPGAAGKTQAEFFVRMLAGYSVKTERVSGDKMTRADPLASQVNAGNVRLVKGEWNKAFIEELRTFPLGKHDDQVDASADAFQDLSLGGWTSRLDYTASLLNA